jgi:glyoxylase-like metal-dependent hydrolase (beta-lactamase superfamily II)
MRIHHLDCGSMCPFGGRLMGGAGGPWTAVPMCCHCLLIESEDGLILVDSGLGVEDVNSPERLGWPFRLTMRPRLDVARTAFRQIADLGFRVSEVRHIVATHLDLDHAGGICDFPDAKVHVFAPELNAAQNRSSLADRDRYRVAHISAVSNWAPVELDGESWLGFEAVRPLPRTRDEVLLIPLIGHTRGHCGVAVRNGAGWLLHCGDAYFHHDEVATENGAAPAGLRLFESIISVDNETRRANQARLRELARDHLGEVTLICSHDVSELAACWTAEPSFIVPPLRVTPPAPLRPASRTRAG